MNDIKKIYETLFKAFGPQGWWPLTLEGYESKPMYGVKTRTEKQRLEIIFGAILTQHCSFSL